MLIFSLQLQKRSAFRSCHTQTGQDHISTLHMQQDFGQDTPNDI